MSANTTPIDDALAPNPPEGFQPMHSGGPYFTHLGPLFSRRDDANMVVIGLRVDKKHTNMLGITHGGMLVTFADGALGINLSIARDPPQPMVSVHLSSDFLDAARPGDWMEAHVRIRKQGTRLSFADCELLVGDKTILRCSGVFAVIGRPGAPLPADNDG